MGDLTNHEMKLLARGRLTFTLRFSNGADFDLSGPITTKATCSSKPIRMHPWQRLITSFSFVVFLRRFPLSSEFKQVFVDCLDDTPANGFIWCLCSLSSGPLRRQPTEALWRIRLGSGHFPAATEWWHHLQAAAEEFRRPTHSHDHRDQSTERATPCGGRHGRCLCGWMGASNFLYPTQILCIKLVNDSNRTKKHPPKSTFLHFFSIWKGGGITLVFSNWKGGEITLVFLIGKGRGNHTCFLDWKRTGNRIRFLKLKRRGDHTCFLKLKRRGNDTCFRVVWFFFKTETPLLFVMANGSVFSLDLFKLEKVLRILSKSEFVDDWRIFLKSFSVLAFGSKCRLLLWMRRNWIGWYSCSISFQANGTYVKHNAKDLQSLVSDDLVISIANEHSAGRMQGQIKQVYYEDVQDRGAFDFFRFTFGVFLPDGIVTGEFFLFLLHVQRSPVSCRRTRTPPSSGTSAAPPWPGCVSMRTACSTITSSWTATRTRMWKSCRASWSTVSFSTAHRWRNKCSWRYLKSSR